MWGLGCVLAEMVHCSDPYSCRKNFSSKARILFKGDSCYPLSPRAAENASDAIEVSQDD